VLITCPSCGARLRSHAVDTDGAEAAFEVQVVGRPQARRRVVIPWDEAQKRRLAAWLVVASIVTVGLVLALFVLARGL